MLSKEKAKRKEKPNERPFEGTILLALIPLTACLIISWLMFTRHSSDVPLLDGLSSWQQAQAIILERLPLGSSRAEVENFITEHLQPSEKIICNIWSEPDSICIESFGKTGLCSYMVWYLAFNFENQVLSKLDVNYGAGCRGS